MSGCLAISSNCASANFLASALAAAFSLSVKSARPLIASSFLANSSSIAFLAASLATGFTAVTSAIPLSSALFTAV